jgi:hypothetical protein
MILISAATAVRAGPPPGTMSTALAFKIVEALTLPIWACWILAPRSRLARHLANADWPWLSLGAVYLAVLVTFVARGGGLRPDSWTSLDGLTAVLAAPWGALGAWVHLLCVDLFLGRWMVGRAPNAGYRLAPVLVVTLLFGPLGLVLFLVMRRRLESPRELLRSIP